MRRQQFTAAVIQGVLFYKVLSGVPYFMDKVKGNRVSIYINIFQIPLDKIQNFKLGYQFFLRYSQIAVYDPGTLSHDVDSALLTGHAGHHGFISGLYIK